MLQEVLDRLADVYRLLNEWDLWRSIWSRRCRFGETQTALSYSQQGCFAEAAVVLEQAIQKQQQRLTTGREAGITVAVLPEMDLWENEWARSLCFSGL